MSYYILVKMNFWPLWPQMTPDEFSTDNFCTGYLADEYIWVTLPYHAIYRRNSNFGENDILTPVTPNDPEWILNR